MSRPFSGVLIGCGFFAQNHLHAWAEIDRVKIVALCDQDIAKSRALAARFGVPRVYADAEEMAINEKPDFADIVTTSASHRLLVETVAPHVRLVISQKPMADTMADTQAMVAASNRAGGSLLIHENFRWQRPFQIISRLIAEGEIGHPHFARLVFRHGYDNYVNQPYLAKIKRFSLMDVGLHLFDLSRLLLGEAQSLACRTQRLNPVVMGEDAFTAFVGHEAGSTSEIECSFFSRIVPEPFPQTLAWIEGDSGTLQLDADYQLTMHGRDGRKALDVEPPVPAWGSKPWYAIQDSVLSFQRHALAVLNGAATPQPSGENNLGTLAIALSAYEAMETRSIIDLGTWEEGRA